MIDDVMLEAEEKMEAALDAAKRELAAIRTGRANPSMFNSIVVDYYGAPTPCSSSPRSPSLRRVPSLSAPSTAAR